MKILDNGQKAVLQMAVDTWLTSFQDDIKDKERRLRVSLLREASSHHATGTYVLETLKDLVGDADAVVQLKTKLEQMKAFRVYISDRSPLDVHAAGFANLVKTVSVATISVALEVQRDIFFDRLQDVLPSTGLHVIDVDKMRQAIKDAATLLCDTEQLVQYFQDFFTGPLYNKA